MIHYHSSKSMPEIKDRSVQAIITSPPYPMIKKWDKCFQEQFEVLQIDYEYPVVPFNDIHYVILNTIFKECFRILQDGGILALNIGDATRSLNGEFICFPNYAQAVSNLFAIGFTPLIPIFWKKITNRPNAFLGSGFLPGNAYVSQDCEYIAILRKGGKRAFSAKEKEKRAESALTKPERDLYYQQIWEIQGKRGSGNTSSWPEEIPYRLMRMFTIKDDTIVDPFCGKETGAVYEKNGRIFIGYEINKGVL